MPTALINLKTNFRELKYGNDRPDGGSSNQPYIKTGIPGGEDFAQDLIEQQRANDTPLPDAADFILRGGYLAAVNAFKDGERLGRYFIDLKTPSGLLFTLKQQLLERQNPDVEDDINRIYNPLGTVLQAGVLPIGYHLNKQGFNVFRLGYNDGGRAGYYPVTNEQKSPDVVSNYSLNRLAASYLIKITSNQTATNLYNIDETDDNILLSYPGGPNSFLGIGKTKIRIQNPTRPVKSILDSEKFQPSYFSTEIYNPKYLTPVGPNPYVNYVYNPFSLEEKNIASKFINLAGSGVSGINVTILTRSDVNDTLNRFADTISAKQGFTYGSNIPYPGNRYFTYGDNLTPEIEIQYFNSVKANSEGTSSLGSVKSLREDNVKSPISFPYPPQPGAIIGYKDPNAIKGNPDYLVPKISTDGILFSQVNLSSSLSAPASASASYNPELNREENVGVNGRFVYKFDNKKNKQEYLVPSSSTNNITVSVSSSNPQNAPILQGTIPTDVKVLDGIKTRNIGNGSGQHWIGASEDNKDKPTSTNYSAIKDFRKEAGSSISTDYSNPNGFNRETTYKVSSTAYKRDITSYDNSFSSDLVNDRGEDLIDFNFTLANGDQIEPNPIFFRAYIEDWNDGVKADWTPVKYLGRAENFYKYNGWSRSAGVTFLLPTLSKQDLMKNYARLNKLMWSVSPSYSPASDLNVSGVMRGVITYITIGDYFVYVPSIINNIGITPISDMGWEINRKNDGSLSPLFSEENDANNGFNPNYTGQLPKGLKIQLDFTPLHDFVPQYGEVFIGNKYMYGDEFKPKPTDEVVTD